MLYRINPKNGDRLSQLGFGCMRFTRKGAGIDPDKAYAEMALAVEKGVNYFDTAYIYPGSEMCLGGFLEKYGCRDRINIATKLPHYFINKPEDMDKYFSQELERLRTDHVDYYLLHMLNDPATFDRLEALGIRDWIGAKKRSGAIRNIGFSFHGGTEKFKALVDRYDWDFCQIQFNYLDERAQAGLDGLRYAASKGLPVVIMEPLRGGKLAGQLPAAAKSVFDGFSVKRSYAEWGLRWVWDHPEVTVVLSGMNDASQVEENARIASEAQAGSLSQAELDLFDKAKAEINRAVRVGCTGCGYCMPCPKGVDIPNCFAAYNRSYTEGWAQGMMSYFMCSAMRKEPTGASQCIKCGRCEARCPQGLHIRDELINVKHRMENPVYKIGRFFAGLVQKY